jgi:hypothetical protein
MIKEGFFLCAAIIVKKVYEIEGAAALLLEK